MWKPRLSGVSILMYHSVGEDSRFFTVSVQEFRRQMMYLKEKKFLVRRLSEVVRDMRAGRTLQPSVVITFDDGYKNFLTHALPVLNDVGFPATVFIASKLLGTSDIVTAAEVTDVAHQGRIDFMPHTATHRILREATREEQRYELHTALADIQKLVHIPEPVIAYPKGKYTDETVTIAHETGYCAGVTVHEGIVHAGDALYELKRNSIDSSTTFGQFKAKVSDAIAMYVRLKNFLHL